MVYVIIIVLPVCRDNLNLDRFNANAARSADLQTCRSNILHRL